ncbi:hypothetical protein [Umezawaea tangerina]|uniref:Uncharacterized protein n=1 Tax=Umezawaea tangerina TaxID=84725 RepID=A0A2T0TJS5_9PSEU|nr:hypothetical protein [Umezawaea tangerina]PRY45972.1 hypothetical protein CLV43_101236 [Umezawaea tangerina]
MTFYSGNDMHRAALQPPPDDFDDMFDSLLEQSSLGTPNSLAVQAMTQEEIAESMQNQVEARDLGGGGLEADSDVDDILLDLVRSTALPNESEAPGGKPADDGVPVNPPSRPVFVSSGLGDGRTRAAMLMYLAGTEVFAYVRRDVARSILDIAFRSACGHTTILVLLASSAAGRSGIADEVADHLRCSDVIDGMDWGHLPLTRDHVGERPAAELCSLLDQENEVVQSGTSWGHRLASRARGCAHRPVRWWRRDQAGLPPVVKRDTLDDLVEVIEQFVRRWSTGRSAPADPSTGQPARTTSSISALSGALLGLLHEGPKNHTLLVASGRLRLGLPDLTRAGVCQELHVLSRSGLIHPTGRIYASPLKTRYQLTDCGKDTFQRWLLDKPDCDRGDVVLRLLHTTSFTSEQCARLIAMSTAVEMDTDQADVITRWVSRNVEGRLVPRKAGHVVLMNLIRSGRR